MNPHSPYYKKKGMVLFGRTDAFKEIYENYKNLKNEKDFRLNLDEALKDYRTEKLNSLSDAQVVKEEIGSEVRKYKEKMNMRHRYALEAEKSKRYEPEEKTKENRLSVYVLFNKFNNEGRFDPPGKKGKKKANKSSVFLNKNRIFCTKPLFKVNMRKCFSSQEKKLTNGNFSNLPFLTPTNTLVTNTKTSFTGKRTFQINRDLEYMASKVEENSKMLKDHFRHTLNNFNGKFTEYKRTMEYLIPEINKKEN